MKLQKYFRATFIFLSLFLCAISSAHAATLKTLDGATIHASDLRGKWVYINYWAKWCPSCRREVPALNAFYQSHKGNVVVLGVDYDKQSGSDLRNAANKMGIQFPVLVNDPQSVFGLPGVDGLPTTFVLSPSGKLVNTLVGEQSRDNFESAMK